MTPTRIANQMVSASIENNCRSRYDRNGCCLYVEHISDGFRVGIIKKDTGTGDFLMGDELTRQDATIMLRGALVILIQGLIT